MLNEKKEEYCISITHERKYYKTMNTFIKRSLRPHEWQQGPNGKTHVPAFNAERLLNEGAALEFIARNTNVPVPKLYACFKDDGVVYLITELIEGRRMDELSDEDKLIVQSELEGHLSLIHQFRSIVPGGPTGIVVPPYRAQEKTSRCIWKLKPAETDEYVFCHNDLSMQNVIVHNDSLKIRAILDWEYAGYWPENFEKRFFHRLGPSVALDGEDDDSDAMLAFLQDIVA